MKLSQVHVELFVPTFSSTGTLFFTLLPIFLLLVIKGQFFPCTQILFQSAFVFSYKNVASESDMT
jgi:hypothetical protein